MNKNEKLIVAGLFGIAGLIVVAGHAADVVSAKRKERKAQKQEIEYLRCILNAQEQVLIAFSEHADYNRDEIQAVIKQEQQFLDIVRDQQN